MIIAKVQKIGETNQVKKQLEEIAHFDMLSFYKLPDISYIEKDDIIIPEDLEMSVEIGRWAFRLPKGEDSYYNEDGSKVKEEMTDEQKEKALKILVYVQKVKLIKYFAELYIRAIPTADHEKATWERQKIESDKYELDNEADVPFIERLAEVRGIELSDLSAKIQEKADMYTLEMAELMGTQHKLESLVKSSTNIDEFRENIAQLPAEAQLRIW